MMNARKTSTLILAVGLVTLAACGRGKEERSRDVGSTPPAGQSPPTTTAIPPRPDPGQAPVDPQYASLEFLQSQPLALENEIAIGNIYLNRGDADSALVHYQQATRLDPKSVSAWNYAGITLTRLGRFAEAKTSYEKAAALDGFYAHTFINLGNLYFKQEKFDLAAKEYLLATTIDSTDARAWLNLGLAYERLQQINPAILAYNKAAECDLTDPTPLERLGWIYYDKMIYDAARDRWGKAVARDPSRQDLIDNIAGLKAYADSTGTR
jgi:Flp pilus assembly protein TadD